MTDIGKAYVQIVPSADGISGSVSKILDPEATSAGISAGKNLGSSLGSAIAGALSAIGVEKIIESSLKAGGDLQQSFGGLETIYGKAAEQAKEFAMQATSAGISANDYAEQAVSFGASLKQAFSGDTQKAMEAANTAIMDMTDNAAKMGTPIESIQSAYQGFAKQNYTMLDNLKLGYGGTKTEMERLLKDAEKLSGVKYDISNLGDVYDAIHVIQGELGLTGVAAEEAKTTLTGSFGAAKAALTNFLATLSTGGDITGPLQTLIETMGTFLFNNLVPMLWNIVSAIPPTLFQLLTSIVPQISAGINELINSAPGLLEAGKDIITNVMNGFLSGLPDFIRGVGEMLSTFISFVMENFPAIMETGKEIILNVVSGIVDNLPEIISAVIEVMANLLTAFYSHLPEILETGTRIIAELVAGLINAIPKIIAALPRIVDTIIDRVKNVDWLGLGRDIIAGIARGISNAAGIIANAAINAARSAFDAAKRFLGIGSPSKLFEQGVGKWIPAGIAEGIDKSANLVSDAVKDVSGMSFSAFAGSKNQAPAYGNKYFTFNITGAEGQDVFALARAVADIIEDEIEGENAVYA